MGGLGGPELLMVLVVIMVLFGGAKVPELARSLGKARREFDRGAREGMAGDRPADPPTSPSPLPQPPAEAPPVDPREPVEPVAPSEETEGPTV